MNPAAFLLHRGCGLLLAALPLTLFAQGMDPTIRSDTTIQVSEHVFMIPDESRPLVPNVGIVVGEDATLVIDSGLGLENGTIVLEQARTVAKGHTLYVAATHMHPEHDLGAMAFPDDASVIRSASQEMDIEEFGMALADRFATFSARTAELLEGAYIRESDIVFHNSHTLDLGGVHVRLIDAGPAHTRGDLALLVVEDSVLFTGDVVMNEFPNPISPASSVERWLDRLDELEGLRPRLIVPCHYPVGGIEMIARYRRYFLAVRDRTLALAVRGAPRDQIMKSVQEEVAAMFPEFHAPNRIRAAVNVVLRERSP